ncbi:NapC/NirT family cytochrome c [Seongchinamella unica]|nr:NapC/NirT family cytochrome c [Seongchinamella unica]
MRMTIIAGLAAIVLTLGTSGATAQASSSEACLECHDYGEDSPVHLVLAGAHGTALEAGDDRQGCIECHGGSADHMRAPRRNSPDVSFGPRWSSTAGAQDQPCLGCHEQGTASNWRHALHMHNNLTCITCHDIHTAEDKVQVATSQAGVCETCHKVQKQGVHGMERRKKRNPPCTECHNPHNHEDAQAQMLRNGSAGCLYCHDLERMAASERVSAKAKSYHKVMTNPERTCLDCHEGIAHAAADSAPPMHPQPVSAAEVTLFYPGMTDSDWLLHLHPGSQPLRQGANCQQCHRGDEAGMGEILADGSITPAARNIALAFAVIDNALRVTVSWESGSDDRQLAIMWGDRSNDAFARGGCFAACHNDMAGMSRDSGRVGQKYLGISREQRQQIGQPAIVRSEDELARLRAEGHFAEIWRLDLDSGTVDTAILLAETPWESSKLIEINTSSDGNRRSVAFTRMLGNTDNGLNFNKSEKYTLGVALSGKDNPGAKHWVSLPLTLSFGGNDTDFTAE